MMVVLLDDELRRRHAGAQHLLRRNLRAVDGEAAERPPELVERQPGVEQRAQHHVARRAVEAIEVENARHAALHSTCFSEAEIARVGQDHVIDDVDAHDLAGLHQPARQIHIIAARRGIARRMIVEEHHGRSGRRRRPRERSRADGRDSSRASPPIRPTSAAVDASYRAS